MSLDRLIHSSSRRAWSRLLSLAAAAVIAAGVLTVASGAVRGVAPSAKADNCPDVAVTFARGTDEPAGLGRVGEALVDGIRQNTGKNVDAYAVNYRATLLQIHGNDGAKDAIKHIKEMADKCPATPQVLGGYSQGASVVDIVTGTQIGGLGWGDSLPANYADHVVAVTTFGNAADRSGGSIAAQSALFGAKAVDYCNAEDPICHAGQGNEWKGHTEGYVPVYTSQAASFVATRLLSVLPRTGPDGPLGPAPGPAQGPEPGLGPLPGPAPTGQAPSVVDDTHPVAFR